MLNNIVKEKCRESAYKYLMKKRGSKGSEIEYSRIEMAQYLLPNKNLTIDEQRELFAVRNRMVDIPSNFSTKENNLSKCVCQQKEDMQHIYICEYLNTEEPKETFEKLFSKNVKRESSVFERFENNMKIREEYLNKNDHQMQHINPPYSVLECVYLFSLISI